MDLKKTPVRKIPLPDADGDAWAQPAAQVAVPDSVARLRSTGETLRYSVIAYDGTNMSAAPDDGATTTFDTTVVKIRVDEYGNTVLTQLATVADKEGDEVRVGRQITEKDMSDGEIFVIGLVSSTQGDGTALWIYVDAGAIAVPEI